MGTAGTDHSSLKNELQDHVFAVSFSSRRKINLALKGLEVSCFFFCCFFFLTSGRTTGLLVAYQTQCLMQKVKKLYFVSKELNSFVGPLTSATADFYSSSFF